MNRDQIEARVKALAPAHGLDPDFVLAFIEVESGFQPFATRYEPMYVYLQLAALHAERTGVTKITEEVHQKTSWGLMQLMGGVCRELGFKGHMPEVCVVDVNITLGCKKLVACYHRWHPESGKRGTDLILKEWSDPVVAAYNAGSPRREAGGQLKNWGYVQKVRAAYLRIKRID